MWWEDIKSLDVTVFHHVWKDFYNTLALKKNLLLLNRLEKEKTTPITITNLDPVKKIIIFCCLLVWWLKLTN